MGAAGPAAAHLRRWLHLRRYRDRMGERGVVSAVEAALVAHFGVVPDRASMSFVGVEPIDVLRFDQPPSEEVYVSLGMSASPMSGADAVEASVEGPRAELLLHLRGYRGNAGGVWRRIGVLAATPEVEGFVYSEGVSVDIGEPLVRGSGCVGAVLTAAPLSPIETTHGTVRILRLLPATSTELAWCRVRGSEALRARWSEQGTDLLDLLRDSVPLT